MGAIILPRRFKGQPQGAIALAPGYRDAEILSLFNDGTGRDLAKGNHLVPGVAPKPVVRPQGRSLDFNGSSQYLVSTRTVTPGSQFTVFVWVRPDNTNSGYVRIIETAYNTGFYLGSNSGTQYAWIVNNASLEGCIGGQQVIGQRDFVCGVFDGTNRILYINGVQVGSASATAPSTALTVTIGSQAGSGAGYWNGGISNVGIFNRAFPAAEIWSLYQDPWRLIKAPARRLWVVPAGSGVTGSLAYTNLNDTLAASGTTTVTGTLARTNANDTVSASGTTTVTGSLAKTNANDTCNASGSVGSSITGSLAYTNKNDTAAASGTTTVTGSLAKTNANDTATAVGTTTVNGSLSKTNANDTAVASGTTTVVGSLAKTNNNDTCAASGTVTTPSVSGTLAYTNRNDTLSASGTTTIKGSLSYLNNNDRLSAFGVVNNGILFEADLLTGQPVSTAIKKPGIPSGTADWEKTIFEIMLGRRGNAIPIPAEQPLTFSSTPTKAECQALLAYTNIVRDALDQLITRFDS